MCRFVYYFGPPLPVSSLVTEPEHSLIRQSFDSFERATPTNGDGFGVAWYPEQHAAEPGLFRSITPAWSNANLSSMARVTRSSCILAHIRAATRGRTPSEANSHPFVAGRYSFMHNGDLGAFDRVRRPLLSLLDDESFAFVQGQTDSEHLFALFLTELGGAGVEASLDELAQALEAAMRKALELVARHGDGAESHLNLALSDGSQGLVTRFTSRPNSRGESLYCVSGRQYRCEDGACHMVEPGPGGAAVIVSSERLTSNPGWESVPPNHMLLIHPDRSVEQRALALSG